jgi:hypothetical protein
MTKVNMIKQVRFLLDCYDSSWLRDGPDANRFSISDALDNAYVDFATKTRCVLKSFTMAASASQSEYAFSAFGTGAAKMFEITNVAYNSIQLYPELATQLTGDWRFTAAGTPNSYILWGSQTIKLNPAPSTSGTIYIEGYCVPDVALFTSGASPLIPDTFQQALVYDATMKIIVRNPSQEYSAKLPFLKNEYDFIMANAIDTFASTQINDVKVGSKFGYANQLTDPRS